MNSNFFTSLPFSQLNETYRSKDYNAIIQFINNDIIPNASDPDIISIGNLILGHVYNIINQHADFSKIFVTDGSGYNPDFLAVRTLLDHYLSSKLKAQISSQIGEYFRSIGDFEEALSYIDLSYHIYLQIADKEGLMTSLASYSKILMLKGWLNSAIEYINKCLTISKENNNLHWMVTSRSYLSQIYYQMGKTDLANQLLLENIDLSNQYPENFDIYTISRLEIVEASIISNDIEKLEKFLDELEKNRKKISSELYSKKFELLKGMFLSSSTRIKDKAQAQIVFEDLIENSIFFEGIEYPASIYLSAMLLEEYQLFKNEKAFQDAKNIINSVYKRTKEQNLSLLLIDVLIILAKISAIEFQFQIAFNYIDQAVKIIETMNLSLKNEIIIKERDLILKKISEWETSPHSGDTLERIRDIKLHEYLKTAKNVLHPS